MLCQMTNHFNTEPFNDFFVLEGIIGHGWPSPKVIAGVIVTALALVVIETD